MSQKIESVNRSISIGDFDNLINENNYLRDEIKEETDKLKITIEVLHKEIEILKEKNRKLEIKI